MSSKSKAKGYRTIAKAREYLESKGYISSSLEKTGRFVKEKDLFGLWDFLFIKDTEHLFIQFKTNKKIILKKGSISTWLKPFIKFGMDHGNEFVKYQVWNKCGRNQFEVLECNKYKLAYKIKLNKQ